MSTDRSEGALVGPTLDEVAQTALRGFLPALLLGLLLAFLAWTWSEQRDPVYRATSTVLTYEGNSASDNLSGSISSTTNLDALGYATALMSDSVVAGAMARLGIESPTPQEIESFRSNTSVSTDETRDTTVLRISFEDTSARRAAETATALAEALQAWDARRVSQALARLVSAIEVELAALDGKIEGLLQGQSPVMPRPEFEGVVNLRTQRQAQLFSAVALAQSAGGSVEITQPAVIPTEAVYPRPPLMALAAFGFGFLLAYVILLLRSYTDRRLRTIDDLVRITGKAPLAQLPGQSTSNDEYPAVYSSYLRTSLFPRARSRAGAQMIALVTSAREHENQDTVAIGLAKSFVHSGARTLLIDADLHAPRIARRLDLRPEQAIGLLAYLRRPDLASSIAPNGKHNGRPMVIVPNYATSTRSADVLTQGFEPCLAAWRSHFDVIVICCAPVLPVADSLVLAPLCDRSVLTVSLGRTNSRDLEEARDLLDRFVPDRWGSVAVNVPRRGLGKGVYVDPVGVDLRVKAFGPGVAMDGVESGVR